MERDYYEEKHFDSNDGNNNFAGRHAVCGGASC